MTPQETANLKKQFLKVINPILDAMAKPEFEYNGPYRPLLFLQEPFSGTHAVVCLKEVYHPSETVKCMDFIHEALIAADFDCCIIAKDLTELEINL
jgi:hypothetical protein